MPFFAVARVWTVVLKGFALWYSARAGQKWWFIALLVVNTLGILEIVYLSGSAHEGGLSHDDHHTHAPRTIHQRGQ